MAGRGLPAEASRALHGWLLYTYGAQGKSAEDSELAYKLQVCTPWCPHTSPAFLEHQKRLVSMILDVRSSPALWTLQPAVGIDQRHGCIYSRCTGAV